VTLVNFQGLIAEETFVRLRVSAWILGRGDGVPVRCPANPGTPRARQQVHPRLAQVAQMRYFGGYSEQARLTLPAALR
jgi:hypothetical protein